MTDGVDTVVAVGVNCTDPAGIGPAVEAAERSGKPVVVYPNSGETWDAVGRRWTGTPGVSSADVLGWIDAGARLVGGCCRVRPADIRTIAMTVRTASAT
jgi:homocysteine S-methyltransferase